MSAITAKASRKMKKYAVLTREPRCFLGSFDFSWEQRKFEEIAVRSSVICSDDTLPRVEYEDIVSGTGRLNKDIYAKQSIKTGIAFHQGDVLYGKLRPYLQNWLLPTFDGLAVGDFWVLQPQNADSSFLYRLIQSRQFDEVANQSTGTKMPRADWKLVSKTVFSIPSNISEQAAIGTYFTALDSLITLHQRKCALLFSPFQALISMMFTTSTFSWEQRKLGDVVKEITRNDPESEAPIMMITANNGFIEQSERYAFNNAGESLKKYILLKKGELAYNHGASKLRPYGSCFALTTAENARIPFVYHCFSAENQNAEFMSIELNGAEIENQLRKIVSSGARMDGLLNISFDEYTSVSVILPGTEEQDRIADFFRHLDNLITLHQRKCISFTGRAGRLISTVNKKRITSSWEQRKFEEIAVRSSAICSDDTLPRVEYEDIVSGTGRLNKDIYAKQSIKTGIAFHQGDVLYGKLRPYLQNWLLPTFDGLAVGDFWVLQPQNADSSFLYRLIQSRQFDEVANQSTGTKMPRADWKLVSKTVFSIPSNISEQAAIGTYFTALDSLITLHQRKPFLMKWRNSDANRNQTNRLVL